MEHERSWLGKARRALMTGAVCAMLAGCGATAEQDRAAIERDILGTPGAQDLWATVKEEFPEDFNALVDQVQALDFVERRDAERVKQIGADWLRGFFDRITPLAVKAPADELIAWSAAEYQLYATLQRGAVRECAAMTMGEWIFIEPSNAAATAALARRNAAMVRASAAGKRDPQVYAEPSEAEFGRLGDAIAATGIDPRIQGTLGDIGAMEALSPDQQCALGVAVYQGLASLPDDVEPPMAAYMLSPEPTS